MQVQPEKLIATYEDIELQGRGKVRFTVTERRVIVEKKASIFSKNLMTIMAVDYSRINSISQDGDSFIKIDYADNFKPATAVFIAKDKGSALSIMNQISEILQESKKRLEEEAKKKKQAEVDDALFVIYLYESMIAIWSMISPIREMLSTIRQGDWNKSEVHANNILSAAYELTKDSETNLAQAMGNFYDAIKSRSPEAVNERISEMFLALGATVNSKSPISNRWLQYSRSAHPNWSSMPYFLMFALGVNDLLVSSELSKNKEVEEAIRKIKRILPIVEVKVGKYLVEGFTEAINAKDIFGIPQRISNLLLDELQKYLTKAANL